MGRPQSSRPSRRSDTLSSRPDSAAKKPRCSPVKVIGYTRCSSAEQATDGMSLDAQRSRIESWCDATAAVLSDVVEDGGVSGSQPLARRPGGQRLAALLDQRRPPIDAVVIARLDRLGRDAAETLSYLRRFTE